MNIQAQRWLAVWYRCPQCKESHASTMMKRALPRRAFCIMCECKKEVVEYRYYTTFAIDFYSCAGTCHMLGPFLLCDYVYPNIRVFERHVALRRAELEKQAQEDAELRRKQRQEFEARLKKEREEAALRHEVERIAYQRHHAAELVAEKIAQAVWPQEEPALPDDKLDDDSYHPF